MCVDTPARYPLDDGGGGGGGGDGGGGGGGGGGEDVAAGVVATVVVGEAARSLSVPVAEERSFVGHVCVAS
jgi:hypothetical protein